MPQMPHRVRIADALQVSSQPPRVPWSVWAAAWPVAPLPPPGLGHLRAVGAVGGKHAVEAGEIDARFGHQRGQPGDEIQRLEEHLRGAVRVGRLQLVAHQAAGGEPQPRLRQCRAADAPLQAFERTGAQIIPRGCIHAPPLFISCP
jgi:hypothetical protein